jgi:ABC-type sulfate/molybdate transport systems ATPase subunit
VANLTLRILSRLRAFAVDLELTATPGTLALVGPSGAGKTTVLRSVAGVRRPDAGRIALDDEVWFDAALGVDLPPERRSVGLVPQHHALFPHLDVRANVGFGGTGRVDELLARLRIAHLAHARPGALSGGERQRVALARALAREPKVLLLDEPLAALDAHTRALVRAELQDVLVTLDLPTLLVTHDFRDSAALADRIAVIQDGRVHQIGTPAQLLEHPADAFVASFTGANLVVGDASGDELTLADGTRLRLPVAATGRTAIAIQPWEIDVRATEPTGGLNAIPGTIESVTPAGGRVRVRIAGLEAELQPDHAHGLSRGMRAWACFEKATARIVKLGAADPQRPVSSRASEDDRSR